MPKTTQIKSSTSTYQITQEGNYLFGAKSTITTTGMDSGITNLEGTGGFNVTVAGKVNAAGMGIYFTTSGDEGTILTVTGDVVGSTGVYLVGNANSLINSGLIEGGTGIIGADISLSNSGTISGVYGLSLIGDNGHFVNTGSIIGTNSFGVNIAGGDHNRFENDGRIEGSDESFLNVGTGSATLINSGTMIGDIDLGDGSDTFRNDGGRVKGLITAGWGDDFYFVDRTTLKLAETSEGGYDVVKSKVDWTLGENFEVGRLLGKADLSLTGSTGNDILIGNSGDNRIKGGLGSDLINGGRGNDLMTGGHGVGASDEFVFKLGSGHDVITDFDVDTDFINLMGYKGLEDLSKIEDHFQVKGDDLVLNLLGDDTVVLRGLGEVDPTSIHFAGSAS